MTSTADETGPEDLARRLEAEHPRWSVPDELAGLAQVSPPLPEPAAPDAGSGPAAVHARIFPALPREAARARAWLTALLGASPAAGDAVACLSELAANAITHSDSRRPGGAFTVTATVTPSLLRVEVTDQGGPWRNHHARPGETGRGLQIVSHLSARSGIPGTGRQSRTVWFEIDGPAARAPEPGTSHGPAPQLRWPARDARADAPDGAPPADQARAAARDLLIRTAELPRGRQQLETIIGQYRTALHALATSRGKL